MKSLRMRLFVAISVSCTIVAIVMGLVSRKAATEGFSIVISESVLERLEADGEKLHRHEEARLLFDRRVWMATLLIAAVGIVATLIISRWIIGPLEHLGVAARRLGKREPSSRIDVSPLIEISNLTDSFNTLAEDLEKTESLRRQLVNDVSHELRTPLNALRGRLEAIQDGLLEPKREVIDSLHRQVLQLGDIVRDLQELALAEAGHLRLENTAVSLKTTILELLDGAERSERQAPVAVFLDGLPPVFADPARVVQVFTNLLDNAWIHTPVDGQIEIKGRVDGDRIEIAVVDNGPGIPPEDLARVFERFYRVDASRDRGTGGIGLGLAIVRRLVEAQGGRVRAESTVDEGSAFIVTLPACSHR